MAAEMCPVDESNEIRFFAADTHCGIVPPFNWICDALLHLQSRRELKRLTRTLNTRTEPVTIDAIDAPGESVKKLIQCQCVTVLKMRQLDQKLLRMFNEQRHIHTLYVFFNPEYPKLPAVETLAVNAMEALDFTVEDINENIANETTKLMVALCFSSICYGTLAHISEFFQINVASLNLLIRFELYCHEQSIPWFEKVIRGIIDFKEMLIAALPSAPSTDRFVILSFKWSQLESFERKKVIMETLLKHGVACSEVDPNLENYIFAVNLPRSTKCKLEISLD